MMTNSLQKRKPIKVLVMSVGPYAKNYTCRYFERIGGKEHVAVCLPMQFESNAQSYKDRGFDVFLYDEKKYINESFEYFGFKPRNCGGVGRQGIAEATEKFGDDFVCFQVDDDTRSFRARTKKDGRWKVRDIKRWENFCLMAYALDYFNVTLGFDIACCTGATQPNNKSYGIVNKKIFNNFIMRKGNALNFDGFAALCSDDYRFNVMRNLLQASPMISTLCFDVIFYQNQGDRQDGNAVIYNSDCSWKKSFSLRMIVPWAMEQHINKEENRVLFRENIKASYLYPPIMLEKDGKITNWV